MKSIRRRIGRNNLTVISMRFVILALCAVGGGMFALRPPLHDPLIDLNTPEGEQLLIHSIAQNDYSPLSKHFVAQANGAYCGVASSVMVLNAMSIQSPAGSESGNYPTFTQNNFFSDAAGKILSPQKVSRQGMTLSELGRLLETYPVKAEVYHTDDSSLKDFRLLAEKNLLEAGNFVLVNYFRRNIGQGFSGHISPVAAYNKETDRFLILDVSRYKYPPVWVKAADLWKAMDTIDLVSRKKRGFVLVSPR